MLIFFMCLLTPFLAPSQSYVEPKFISIAQNSIDHQKEVLNGKFSCAKGYYTEEGVKKCTRYYFYSSDSSILDINGLKLQGVTVDIDSAQIIKSFVLYKIYNIKKEDIEGDFLKLKSSLIKTLKSEGNQTESNKDSILRTKATWDVGNISITLEKSIYKTSKKKNSFYYIHIICLKNTL